MDVSRDQPRASFTQICAHLQIARFEGVWRARGGKASKRSTCILGGCRSSPLMKHAAFARDRRSDGVPQLHNSKKLPAAEEHA